MSTSSTDSARKASSNNLNRQLGFYSIAAAAASVSMLALAQPAAAEVVITKKTIPIPDSSNHIPLAISMANNGIDNFDFFLDASAIEGGSLTAFGLSGRDEVLASCSFYCKALALPRGAVIGPKTPPNKFFTESALIEGSESSGAGHRSLRGDWGGNPKDRYLGVSFPIEGETHYGWVRLTVTTNPNLDEPPISATITAYAYETVANQPILAGTAAESESAAEVQLPENIQNQGGASLGMLAAGADGLPLWRREEALTSR
jgi:hypothetical protein